MWQLEWRTDAPKKAGISKAMFVMPHYCAPASAVYGGDDPLLGEGPPAVTAVWVPYWSRCGGAVSGSGAAAADAAATWRRQRAPAAGTAAASSASSRVQMSPIRLHLTCSTGPWHSSNAVLLSEWGQLYMSVTFG